MLNKEDFNDDNKDAGELGSGHTVTALYEIIPVGIKDTFLKAVDPLKYQKNGGPSHLSVNELMTVKFRYKAPESEISRLIEHPVPLKPVSIAQTSEDYRFATSVAEFGLLLRNSDFKVNASYTQVVKRVNNAIVYDEEGYRKEFIKLVEKAVVLKKKSNADVVKE